MKKIILVAAPLNSCDSYEYYNFLKPLEKMGFIVIPFDFLAHMRVLGREGMNRKLLETVRCEKPEIVFFVPHTDQFIPEIVDEIGRHAITLGYLFDDTWRIEFSRFWASHFRFVTTSDVNGLRKFREAGFTNIIYSPFACNTEIYFNKNLPKMYDVTFLGQYHPYREWYINHLRRSGINVNVWGRGWPSGVISFNEMINIFSQSRINLNLSNCVSWDIRYLAALSRPLKSTLRVWRQAMHAITRSDMKTWEMVKGRFYEINACGGFQLSFYVEGLERLYSIGEEIAIFASPDDLVEKIFYYLKHNDEREAIARRGQERTLRDHTMEKRLVDLFNAINL